MSNRNLKSINVIASTSMFVLSMLLNSDNKNMLAKIRTYWAWYGTITFILFWTNSYFTDTLGYDK